MTIAPQPGLPPPRVTDQIPAKAASRPSATGKYGERTVSGGSATQAASPPSRMPRDPIERASGDPCPGQPPRCLCERAHPSPSGADATAPPVRFGFSFLRACQR